MTWKAVGGLVSLMVVLGSSGCAAPQKMAAGDVPRMEVGELKARLGDPALVVIDVRAANDWESSQAKIKGAVREVGKNVADWASNYPKDKAIVLYCT